MEPGSVKASTNEWMEYAARAPGSKAMPAAPGGKQMLSRETRGPYLFLDGNLLLEADVTEVLSGGVLSAGCEPKERSNGDEVLGIPVHLFRVS